MYLQPFWGLETSTNGMRHILMVFIDLFMFLVDLSVFVDCAFVSLILSWFFVVLFYGVQPSFLVMSLPCPDGFSLKVSFSL